LKNAKDIANIFNDQTEMDYLVIVTVTYLGAV